MSSKKIIEFNRGKFCLKVTIEGRGDAAIVIGSHKYYPRTFSKKLKATLKFFYVDTRVFATNDPKSIESDFTINKIVEDIETIREALDIKKAVFIGHSIHALVALEYVKRFPDHVSHLALIASAPIAMPEIAKEANQYLEESVCPERKSALVRSIQKFTGSNRKESFVTRLFSLTPMIWYDYNFNAQKLWKDVKVNSMGAKIIWERLFEDYDAAKSLKIIKCPILIALGRYDYFNPPHLWESFRDCISDLTIRVFERSAHTPQLEEHDNFDEEIMKWLEQKAK